MKALVSNTGYKVICNETGKEATLENLMTVFRFLDTDTLKGLQVAGVVDTEFQFDVLTINARLAVMEHSGRVHRGYSGYDQITCAKFAANFTVTSA